MMPTRRTTIAAALVAAGERGVSGEVLARELGVSRVAVSKHVAALRELGYEIESARRVGYRLVSAPDACLPEEVAPRLTDPLWVACEGGAVVGSTNDEARRLARSGAPEGTVVVAAEQIAGRGRFDRTWISPPGGAYCSALVRPPIAPSSAGPLPLVVAIGVARGLDTLGLETGLKWPNDIVVDGRKLAGILVEMAADSDRVQWAVAGVGINVAFAPDSGAAAVREQTPDVRVAAVAAAALDGLAEAYWQFREDGFRGALAAEYHERGAIWGREVTVRDMGGATVARGVARGVDSSGALRLDAAGSTVVVHSGEVTLR